ncbi:hypothetical protein [Oscillatoria sp. FACHB-1406]|nr:hypothetical protein [Oscillatoria sp. FACHB-1406]
MGAEVLSTTFARISNSSSVGAHNDSPLQSAIGTWSDRVSREVVN